MVQKDLKKIYNFNNLRHKSGFTIHSRGYSSHGFQILSDN